MARHIPKFPLDPGRDISGQDPHAVALRQLRSSHADAIDLLAQFDHRKAQIEGDPDLSAAGKQKALRGLGREFAAKLDSLERRFGEAKHYHDTLRASLAANGEDESGLPTHVLIERGFQRHRLVQRFEGLSREQRLEWIHTAVEKGDREALLPLVREPGLLPEQTQRLVESALARSANSFLFGRLEDVGGKLTALGEVEDPAQSPLAVAGFTLSEVRNTIEQESGGVDPVAALERAGARITDQEIVLPHDAGKDATLYRAARDLAMASNRVMSVAAEGIPVEPSANGGGRG